MAKRVKDDFYRYMFRRSVMPLLLILVVICISFLVIAWTSMTYETEKNRENNQNRLQTCVSSTELEMKEIERLGKQLLNGVEFQRFVYMYEDLDIYSRFSLQKEIYRSVYDLCSINEQVESVLLYIPTVEKAITNVHCQVTAASWMEELAEGTDRTCFLEDGSEATCIQWHGDGAEAVLVITWDEGKIMKRVESLFLSGDDSIEWVWGSAGLPEEDAIYADSYFYPFRMIYRENSVSHAERFFTKIGLLGVLFIVLCLTIVIAGMLAWYREIYQPLRRLLIEAFDHMENNDFGYRIETQKESAFIRSIYDKYNHMAESMQQYIETNLQQQILVSQANLKQLQSQISPHFMYNSYYVLYRMIRRGDQENSLRMAEYLGSFYHYITRNSDDEKRLSEELSHARNYAEIQKYRFRDNLEIEIPDPDERIASVYVPRLILQPMLENAFKYAYESGEGEPMRLRISYEVKSGREFDVVIENSGGISDGALERIRERLQCTDMQMETTALINIDRRLKIYFGKESGLSVDRSGLGGLKVIMHIFRGGEPQ